jgi:hypothetical protein
MRIRHYLQAVAILITLTFIASAQTSSGEISGRVVDASGAVIVDAAVTLINQATSDIRTAQTDNAGLFIFVAVQPGTFTVNVTVPKFKVFEIRDLKLSASERLSAGELKLEVSGISGEAVTVTAGTATIQTQSAERSSVVDSQELSTMMSIGRDVLALTRLLPGVVKDEGGSGLGTQGAGTVAGVRESSNAVSVDGVLGNPRGDGNKLDTPIAMDSVSEIKVMLNSYQAEYGGSAGAIINLTTKSGSRQFHGAAYYYNRNEAFNANGFFDNREGNPRGRYRYNTWGYNIGGPIYIPNIFNRNKDKLFFFFSQEGWPTKTNSGYQRYMMPTESERQGDFSNTYDTRGQKVYIRDPLLNLPCTATDQRGCFPNNTIPQNRINSNTQKLLAIFPLPTFNCKAGPYGVGTCPLMNVTSGNPYNYSIFAPRDEPSNQTLLRTDYNISNKWRLYFRGSIISKENRGLTSTTNKHQWGIPSYYATPSKNAGFNLTYVVSPSLVNEFTAGYASWDEQQGFDNSADLEKLSKKALGITLGQNNPAQNPTDLVPRITGLSSGGSSGTFQLAQAPEINFDNRWPMDNSTGTWEFTDGITKVWNRHTLKAGIYYQNSRYIQRHIGSVFSGNFAFGASTSSPYDTQYAYSNMILGSYTSYQEGSNVVNYAPHWNVLEWYVQDSWRARPNLSVDYGVRFTYDLPTTLDPGFGAGFAPDRYDSTQVPALYMPVAYSTLDTAGKTACKGLSRSTPSRCAQNPNNLKDVKSDAFITTFVTPFGYTGTVINTNPTYPESLRYSNGLLYAPRFGVSWDPFSNGKTAIRFGAGLYYNTREGAGTVGDYSLIAPLVTNASVGFGQVTGSNFLPDCGATNSCYGTDTQVNAGPLDTRILQPNRKIESTFGLNFGIQRQVGFSTVVDVAYVGTFGRHLNQQTNLNATPYLAQFDPKYVDKSQTSQSCYYFPAHHNGTQLCQPRLLSDNYFRAYPGYGAINLRDYGANSNYNSLQVAVNRRFSKGLQYGISYTWSKALTTQDTVNGAVANFQDRQWWNYGLASFDRSHILTVHWTAHVPRASRLWNNRVVKAVGDNWEWSGIAEFISGQPYGVSMSGTPNLTGGGDGSRVLVASNPMAPADQLRNTLQFINQDSFVMPPVGVVPSPNMTGFAGKIVFRGPGTHNWDMALQKRVPIAEQVSFYLRVEAYNIFNHVSFNGVNTTADFDTASSCSGTAAADPRCGSGLIRSNSTFGQVNSERNPRRLQLSARLTF